MDFNATGVNERFIRLKIDTNAARQTYWRFLSPKMAVIILQMAFFLSEV